MHGMIFTNPGAAPPALKVTRQSPTKLRLSRYVPG
jgi:hypothetical protein